MSHTPVLLQEVFEGLAPQAGDVVFDGTAGGGGHGRALAEAIGSRGVYVGVDADSRALERVRAALTGVEARVQLVHGNFRAIKRIVAELGLARVNVILLDLGLSSYQLDDDDRGFSFQRDLPLVMTFNPDPTSYAFTARDIVNSWEEDNIATILAEYGEERFARPIAAAMVARREEQPIETTIALVEVIKAAVPAWYRHRKIHPATKTFQALRIAVNDELGALRQALADGWEALAPGGRFGIIHFHSLEGRLTKEFMRAKKVEGVGELVTKHAIVPSRAEALANPRSRSAQFRLIRKLI